jgi:hypothetical protein
MELALVSFLVLCGVVIIAYAGLHRRGRGAEGGSAADTGSDGGDGSDGGGDSGGDGGGGD